MLPLSQPLLIPTTSLLILFSLAQRTISQHHPSPNDLSPEYKYYPEHEHILQRDLDIRRKLQWQTPSGVKKMSGDPGEKFLLDYWLFDQQFELSQNQSEYGELSNCLRVHYGMAQDSYGPEAEPRALVKLVRRDFECPSGSSACTDIDRPNSCCASDTTCQLIPNTGSGDVGCCPAGQSCGNTLGECRDGSTSCDNDGGGCCLPGYACFQQGCVQTATTTVLVAPSTSTPTPSRGVSTTTVTSITTITRANEEPEVVTTTVVVVDTVTEEAPDPRTTTTTARSTVTTTDCPSEYRSCPESLGGGCCHTDRACATGNRCPASTTSGLQPPDRPTSDTTTTANTSPTTTPPSETSLPPGACPTGFYACKAFHQGGCCQTDRDCDTTSCPPIGSTTVVNTGCVTVAAPTGVGGANVPSGSCRSGWNSCPVSLSGGCCPTGYGCQVSTCTAESTEVSGNVGKIQPESAAVWTKETDVGFVLVAGLFSCLVLAFGLVL